MYPNLYYVFKDWFGVEWHALEFLNTFGLMVALSFAAAAWVISKELQRKEKAGLLAAREEVIIVGKPASIQDLILNGVVGFVFGYKIIGLLFSKAADVNAQDYIFSRSGNIFGGLLIGALLMGLKWREANRQKLAKPEKRTVRIWPHDRVGDIVVLGLIFGILGAKLFDILENLDSLIDDPIRTIFSGSGLTFYGGLIMAAIAICWYAYKKGIKLTHLVDAAAPALMIAYAIGRIGCQVAGDGDWGIYNSAYVNDYTTQKVRLAQPGEYEKVLQANTAYFVDGKIPDANRYNGRTAESLDKVPSLNIKAPSFIPNWMVAYSYPKNVVPDGIKIAGDTDEHNRILPQPVFPTPFYETVICTLFFLFLWAIRKRIKIAGVMFGIYLVLNGVERFLVEKIRVNEHYGSEKISLSQAQIIAICLVIAGVVMGVWSWWRGKNEKNLG
jgi:phosphatidylglycerol---prolipoprotein diacylglyceryl transferase